MHQQCIHCRKRVAGFWVYVGEGDGVRRPWCLTCLEKMPEGDVTVERIDMPGKVRLRKAPGWRWQKGPVFIGLCLMDSWLQLELGRTIVMLERQHESWHKRLRIDRNDLVHFVFETYRFSFMVWR